MSGGWSRITRNPGGCTDAILFALGTVTIVSGIILIIAWKSGLVT